MWRIRVDGRGGRRTLSLMSRGLKPSQGTSRAQISFKSTPKAKTSTPFPKGFDRKSSGAM